MRPCSIELPLGMYLYILCMYPDIYSKNLLGDPVLPIVRIHARGCTRAAKTVDNDVYMPVTPYGYYMDTLRGPSVYGIRMHLDM